MTDDEGLGIAAVQVGEQTAEGCLLCVGAGVGRLSADVEPSLVADADGVLVVVPAVGADHELGTALFDLSAAADNVVVADAEFPALLPVPGVDLGGRALLVGADGTAVNDD